MRAKSVPHVEYEVFKALMDDSVVAEALAEIRSEMVPENDEVASRRFNEGVKSAAKLILNLAERRLHRIPEDHPDYTPKE